MRVARINFVLVCCCYVGTVTDEFYQRPKIPLVCEVYLNKTIVAVLPDPLTARCNEVILVPFGVPQVSRKA